MNDAILSRQNSAWSLASLGCVNHIHGTGLLPFEALSLGISLTVICITFQLG